MQKYLFLSILLISPNIFAVSFDCSKASSFSEKNVCKNELLGKLDDALSKNYKSMLTADFGGSKDELKQEQRAWLQSLSVCTTESCLIDSYKKRIDETCEYGVIKGIHPECALSSEFDR